MAQKWEYFHEEFTQPQANFDELINSHLNKQAAKGWELISATTTGAGTWYTHARLIWRRYVDQ